MNSDLPASNRSVRPQVRPTSEKCSLPDLPAVRRRLTGYAGSEDVDFAREILVAYLINTRELIEQIVEALHQGEVWSVMHAAHSLKSSSQIVGADELSEACAELEQEARSEMIVDPMGKARRIERLFAVYRCSAELLLRTL